MLIQYRCESAFNIIIIIINNNKTNKQKHTHSRKKERERKCVYKNIKQKTRRQRVKWILSKDKAKAVASLCT